MTAKGGTLPGVAAFFVLLTAFAAYAWTASPVMGWLDSPEFVAASISLGVPHSPGHPLPVLLGKLGSLLPVGDVVFRVNLVSALAAAGAAAALQRAGARLVSQAAPGLSRPGRELAAAFAALAFALSWSVWIQGVGAEVYALVGLFLAAFLAEFVAAVGPLAGEPGPDGLAGPAGRDRDPARRDPRAWYAASLWAGLALATHHFIALTVIVPAAAIGLACRPGLRLVGMSTALLCLGLAAFLYLPVRSAQHPLVNWGAPHTAGRFVWTVSAQAFHKAVAGENTVSRGEDAVQVVATMAEQASLLLFIAAILGLYLGLRQRRWRPGALGLAGVIALGAGGRVLIGFTPEIPDDNGYVFPALAALFMLALAGLAQLAHAIRTARPGWSRPPEIVLVAILAALIPWQVTRFAARASMSRARASDAWARWESTGLPPRALLLPAYFQTSFRLWVMSTVENARPDVTVLDRSFLTYPGAADEARTAHPELAPLIDAPLRAGAPTPLAMLTDLAQRRPVMMQLHLNLEPSIDPWLLPAGAFARLLPAPPTPDQRDQAAASDLAARQRLLAQATGPAGRVPPGDMRGLRDALLWHDFIRLGLYCREHRLPAAQATLAHALKLAPEDRMLLDLATRCGLSVP